MPTPCISAKCHPSQNHGLKHVISITNCLCFNIFIWYWFKIRRQKDVSRAKHFYFNLSLFCVISAERLQSKAICYTALSILSLHGLTDQGDILKYRDNIFLERLQRMITTMLCQNVSIYPILIQDLSVTASYLYSTQHGLTNQGDSLKYRDNIF